MRPHGDQLELRWKPSAKKMASEFVLEWRNGDDVDWQRESRRATKSLIKGQVLVWLWSLITLSFLRRQTGIPCGENRLGYVLKSEPQVKKISERFDHTASLMVMMRRRI